MISRKIVFSMFLLAMLALISMRPAYASAISGKVIDENGTPLANVTVKAFDYKGSDTLGTATDADGTYTITGLRAGRFRVGATPPVGSRLLTEYYNGSYTLDNTSIIYLEDDISAANIDFMLSPGSTIMGRVTDSNGIPLQGIRVDAVNRPAEIPAGLLAFKVFAPYSGAMVQVSISLSIPAAANAKRYSHDEQNGWREYPHAEFSGD